MSKLMVPNIRKMFIPDPGLRIYELDLKGADARVVAWEANDEALKSAFRAGIDIHSFNALDLWPEVAHDFGFDPADFHLGLFKTEKRLRPLRHKAKTGVHATDYGCKARTLGEHLNITTAAAEVFIQSWFFKHPGIPDWHRRVDNQLRTRRFVSNIWGFRRHYFDRVEDLLPEALAWIGQSTTAIAINKLIVKLDNHFGSRILITNQTHDSVTFQADDAEVDLEEIKSVSYGFTIPYPDPMEMPVEISSSLVSWGDVKEVA